MTPSEPGTSALGPDADPASDIERLAARIDELEGENAALRAEKAALEAYAALAAHEVVVPLVMTESYAAIVSERLDGDPAHAESQRDLSALARSTARARMLVETLLHDARSSNRPLNRRPVDLDKVVRENLMMLEPEVAEREATVALDPLPVVPGEEPLLSGLFGNLLVNALKYSPRRGAVIRVEARRELRQWRFAVSSGGAVIPAEDRERIFEPFHRARTERRERGTGLGLAICRRIVERHGGVIGVSAADDSGNRFYFTLPSR